MTKKKIALILSMVALMAMFAGCKKVGEVASDVGRVTSEVLSRADDAVSDTVSRLESDFHDTESRMEENASEFRDDDVSSHLEDESVLPVE